MAAADDRTCADADGPMLTLTPRSSNRLRTSQIQALTRSNARVSDQAVQGMALDRERQLSLTARSENRPKGFARS